MVSNFFSTHAKEFRNEFSLSFVIIRKWLQESVKDLLLTDLISASITTDKQFKQFIDDSKWPSKKL